MVNQRKWANLRVNPKISGQTLGSTQDKWSNLGAGGCGGEGLEDQGVGVDVTAAVEIRPKKWPKNGSKKWEKHRPKKR